MYTDHENGIRMYTDVNLFINGKWRAGSSGRSLPVYNPATGMELARVSCAEIADLDEALAAAQVGFHVWRKTSVYDRDRIMRRAALLMRDRADEIAQLLTREQGKPLTQARQEAANAGDTIDWFAGESRRTYGRVIPARVEGVLQMSLREPVGPVAAFTPWNFPISQAVRKVSAALAAGCSIILKGPEETPASCAALIRAFEEAGVPAGVIALVFGSPPEISSYLISHPVIRKVTFTGSTPVGKQLAMLAGQHMKRVTMELGGHAPVIVFEDADVAGAVRALVAAKFRNAGQVCASPTRFLVQDGIYSDFMDAFVAASAQIKTGDGLLPDITMGPLANPRRLSAMRGFVQNAIAGGAVLALGGKHIGEQGNFFLPTILTQLSPEADVLHQEPFGPVATIMPFATFDDAVREANRLPYGLAAYVFTRSQKTASAAAGAIESGMVSINHLGLGLAELPFGGIKDSGYGSEGGSEAIESYLATKLVTQLNI